jgi:hypothetical protein
MLMWPSNNSTVPGNGSFYVVGTKLSTIGTVQGQLYYDQLCTSAVPPTSGSAGSNLIPSDAFYWIIPVSGLTSPFTVYLKVTGYVGSTAQPYQVYGYFSG